MSTETIGGGLTVAQVSALQERNRQEKELQKTCTHEGYSFEKHGRCCFKCGVFMVDWGD